MKKGLALDWKGQFSSLFEAKINMTNDISSIIKAQQVPVRGFQTGQTVEIDTVKTNNTNSQEVPDQGNKIPQQLDKAHFESANSSHNTCLLSTF